ncbi:MAG: class I SAM-dependent methyltransferase, partial [Kofleriaceae bacterium]
MTRGRDLARTIPLLSPHAEALRALVQLPASQLRAAVQARELAAPARATRAQLAHLLVHHAMRARAEADYRETGVAFDSRAAAYPHVRRLVTRYALRRLLDIGCGPGLFAEELRVRRALPRDGRYIGLDVSPAAIELARARLVADSRFAFRVGDAEQLDAPAESCDGIVISFVLSYLDTHAVDRLVATLARDHPRATLIVALTFRSCVDPLEGVEPDDVR